MTNLNQRQTVGDRVRELRLAKGLSQEELALRMGLGPGRQSVVSRIELRAGPGSIKTLFRLARALEIHVSELLSNTGGA